MAMTALAKSALALDANALAQIESLFRDFNHPNAPGASVMVIHNGKPVFAKGFGLADLEKKTPCTTNTNFRLASVTKQFTAMAVLMLVERGKLSLEDRLTDFFPEFPGYGRQITVRHLLTHTSGLLDYEDLIPPGTTIPVLDQDVLRVLLENTGDVPRAGVHRVAWTENAAENEARLNRELQQRASRPPENPRPTTYFPPGTQFRYSNSGFALLALIVEVRSGETFAHFLKENIFEPLKMANTLAYEQGLATVPNRAFGHTPKSSPLSPADGQRASERGSNFERTDQSLTSSVLGDGGVYSSVVDLAKWDAALYGRKLVSEPMLRVAFSPAPGTERAGLRGSDAESNAAPGNIPPTIAVVSAAAGTAALRAGYGFGWFIGEYRGLKEIFHGGDTIGFRTRIARFPEKKFTVIILANRADAKLDELPHQIADLVLFGGQPGPNRPQRLSDTSQTRRRP
jgi:CubicO group peptidase (beta-lactamase class C family)